jgi:hypothetical protein
LGVHPVFKRGQLYRRPFIRPLRNVLFLVRISVPQGSRCVETFDADSLLCIDRFVFWVRVADKAGGNHAAPPSCMYFVFADRQKRLALDRMPCRYTASRHEPIYRDVLQSCLASNERHSYAQALRGHVAAEGFLQKRAGVIQHQTMCSRYSREMNSYSCCRHPIRGFSKSPFVYRRRYARTLNDHQRRRHRPTEKAGSYAQASI